MVLADDHPFLRRNLRMVLDTAGGMDVVGEAGDVSSLLDQVHTVDPEVLIMDIGMPHGPSLSALRQLRREAPHTHVVVTTMTEDPRFAREVVAAGANAFVLKDFADRDLPEAVRRAASGETFVSAPVAPLVEADAPHQDGLSGREVEVLRLIALGHTNTEIAGLLQLSVRTVETHRAHICAKLGLSTRADLVGYALRRGLVAVPSSVSA